MAHHPIPAGTKASRPIPPASESDHTAGPSDAPVTLVEYGDYECPQCGSAHVVTRQLLAFLGPRLRFVFRNFPLAEAHQHALRAAQAAEAAGAQGKFWPMHDMLFENQDALEDEDLIRYAEELGLDAERLMEEVDEGLHADKVSRDFRSGVRSGVNGTPTFFIDGRRYDGAGDLEGLLAAIEAAGRREHRPHAR